jgi:hypothetical protein
VSCWGRFCKARIKGTDVTIFITFSPNNWVENQGWTRSEYFPLGLKLSLRVKTPCSALMEMMARVSTSDNLYLIQTVLSPNRYWRIMGGTAVYIGQKRIHGK